jgi:predicted nucleotidyltransferase
MLPHASIEDIPAEMRATIAARLKEIERERKVRVVLAVESGSRAWGFASPDSDFDVRFIYVRPLEDYAALVVPRDVIEQPIEDLLDLNGWDLRKALTLGLKWNPALVEWLTSPITYVENGWEAEALRKLFAVPLNREALIRHYYGLAVTQYGRHIGTRTSVNLKKYFYVVRPVVALLWLERKPDVTPPMSLPLLLDGMELPRDVADAIVDLRRRKIASSEFGEGERIAVLDAFCSERIEWARARLGDGASGASAKLQRAAAGVFHASVFGKGMPALD